MYGYFYVYLFRVLKATEKNNTTQKNFPASQKMQSRVGKELCLLLQAKVEMVLT